MVAMTLSKIIVVSVNVIFMLFGLAILVIGIIFKVGWDKVKHAFDDDATAVDFDLQEAGEASSIGAIVFGSIILILAFFGCAGACCHNRCMLGTYAVLLMAIVVGQIAVVAVVSVKGGDAKDKLKEALSDTLKKYDETSSDDLSKSWSAIFDSAECCAVNNYTYDFTAHPFKADTAHRTAAGITGTKIPITCCHHFDYDDDLSDDVFKKHKDCLNNPTKDNAYVEGCYDKVTDWVEDNKRVIIGVGIGVLLFEFALSAMAFFLCCRHDDD